MKKVQVLGTGCPKCKQLFESAKAAVEELEGEYEVVKIEAIKEIMGFGVMMTPALAIDGDVKSTGKVLSAAEIRELLTKG